MHMSRICFLCWQAVVNCTVSGWTLGHHLSAIYNVHRVFVVVNIAPLQAYIYFVLLILPNNSPFTTKSLSSAYKNVTHTQIYLHIKVTHMYISAYIYIYNIYSSTCLMKTDYRRKFCIQKSHILSTLCMVRYIFTQPHWAKVNIFISAFTQTHTNIHMCALQAFCNRKWTTFPTW